MSRSKESKKTNRMMDDEYDQVGRDYDQYNRSREGYANEARGRSNQVFDRAYKGYGDFLNQYGAGGDGGGGGGSSSGFRAASPAGFGNRASAAWQRLINGGGLDAENKERIRGKGVFDEFAKTGGLSEGDRSNIRARGTRTVPSFFEGLRMEMERQRNAGGDSPGYNSQMAAMARDQSRAAQDVALDAETDIMDRVNEGRRWGASSMSGAETGLAEMIQRGLISGAQGLSQEDMFNASRLDDMSRFNSSGANSFELGSRGMNLEALAGLRGLRTDAPGEVGMYEDLISNGMNARAGHRANLINMKAGYNPNKGFGDYLMQGLGMAIPAAATFMSPGGFGNKLKKGGGGPTSGPSFASRLPGSYGTGSGAY